MNLSIADQEAREHNKPNEPVPDGYRLLEVGELIEPEDLIHTGIMWRETDLGLFGGQRCQCAWFCRKIKE